LNDVYTIPSINVQTSISKIWHLTYSTSIVSIHPPSHQPIKIFVKEKIVHTFPYKSGREGKDIDAIQLGDLKKIHEQANYTNAILNNIAEQLIQLSAKTDSKKHVARSSAKPSSFTESIFKPFVKLESILKV